MTRQSLSGDADSSLESPRQGFCRSARQEHLEITV